MFPGLCVLRWLDRKVTDWLAVEGLSYEQAAAKPDLLKCSYCPVNDGFLCEYSCEQALKDYEGEVDVLEPHDLFDGTPLSTDGYRKWPDAPHLSWGVDGATSQVEPPLHRQCQRCGDRYNCDHVCLRDSPSTSPQVDGAGPAGVEHSPAPPAGPPNTSPAAESLVAVDPLWSQSLWLLGGARSSDTESAAGAPSFDDIAVPLINDVLAAHKFDWVNMASIGSNSHCSCGYRPSDRYEWEEHVAPLIAAVLETALLQHDAAVKGKTA